MAEWKALKQRLDEEHKATPKPYAKEYEEAIGVWTGVLAWAVDHSDEPLQAEAREHVASLQERMGRPKPPTLKPEDDFWSRFEPTPEEKSDRSILNMMGYTVPDPNSRKTIVPSQKIINSMDGSPRRIAKEVWKDRLKNRAVQSESETSVAYYVARFLKRQCERVADGELAAGRYASLKCHLEHFRDWIGGPSHVERIVEPVLENYESALRMGMAETKWSKVYASDRLGEVKTFVRWLWQSKFIPDLPRNLDALKIPRGIKKAVLFDISEVKKLLKEANQRLKLCLLLMLNTGMTQVDISDLKPEEVDWKKGTITRKRSKTGDSANVPVVVYKLWPETLRLLKLERSDSRERVLLNQNGSPLKVETLAPDGRLKKSDNIASAFKRLRALVKVDKSLKAFRKTSANLLRQEERFKDLPPLFLDHAPTAIFDRHYTDVPQKRLDDGILWLGRKYGIVPGR